MQKELNLEPMNGPFEYVKRVQKEFDDSKIQYSNEYYDTLGMERPDGTENEIEYKLSSRVNTQAAQQNITM